MKRWVNAKTGDRMIVPWKTLCGTAITMFALWLGYDGYLALIAVGALFGVELYGQKKKEAKE
ncbi:unnamed protein product [marine sediment metagenome]|uniref:Uncharacterized protein n=1 Tax=marine sediment metagenome TaxID=412755 RepID=X1KBN9_9ZZZZ